MFACTAIMRLEASVKTSHFHILGGCCREAWSKWILAENLPGEFKSGKETAASMCLIPSCCGQKFKVKLTVHSKEIYICYITAYKKCFFLLTCAVTSIMLCFFSPYISSPNAARQNKKVYSCRAFFLCISLFSFKIHTPLNTHLDTHPC